MALCSDPAGQPQETAAGSERGHQQAPQGPGPPAAQLAPAGAPGPPPGSPRARRPRQAPASAPGSQAGPGRPSAASVMGAVQGPTLGPADARTGPGRPPCRAAGSSSDASMRGSAHSFECGAGCAVTTARRLSAAVRGVSVIGAARAPRSHRPNHDTWRRAGPLGTVRPG